jgi:hypothetical protein
VDTARDLACPELWQQSLERSLARRGKPTRSSLALSHLQPERDLSRSDVLRESLQHSQLRRSAAARRPVMSLPGAGGISALALLAAATVPGLIGGRGGHAGGERVAFRADVNAARAGDGSAAAPHGVGAATANVGPSALAATVAAAHAGSTATAIHTSSSSSTALHPAPKHVALAHDATASGGASGAAAHALSGGAALVASSTSAAPRVPGNPQPSGHPSTGGGAVEDVSHAATSAPRATSVPISAHTPAHSVSSAHAVAPTHPVTNHPAAASHPPAPSHPAAKPHPATTPHPVTKANPVTTTHPTTTTHSPTTTHPATTTHPTTTTHPVAASHPAPKPAAPTPPVASGGYTNPLAGAHVTPERIDQGVDYAGSGTLGAIGAGKVTYVATSGTGWPGAFIEYQLSGGSYAGRYVYYAEGVSPAGGVHVGETLQTGQPVAEIIPGSSSGIEIGWGAGIGTETLAMQLGQWSGNDDSDSVPSQSGESFSALIASLGGPPGKIEG